MTDILHQMTGTERRLSAIACARRAWKYVGTQPEDVSAMLTSAELAAHGELSSEELSHVKVRSIPFANDFEREALWISKAACMPEMPPSSEQPPAMKPNESRLPSFYVCLRNWTNDLFTNTRVSKSRSGLLLRQ